MKTRTSRLLNIVGINLLLLALYLNFIHEDNNTAPQIPVKETIKQRPASNQNRDEVTKAATTLEKKDAALN